MNVRRSLAGFSLAEMAITLLIITLLTSGTLMALRVQTERSRHAQTQAALLEAKQAVLAFAATQGRLPCPAIADPAAITPANSGVENCALTRGLLPWRTLGVQGVDAWDQYLSYQVTQAFAQTGFLTTTLGTVLVRDAYSAAAAAAGEADSNAFAIWSHGANGNGSIGLQNTLRALSTNNDERANAPLNPLAPTQVILRAQTDGYDDIGTSVSRFVLFKQLLDAGIAVPRSSSSSSSGGG